MADERDDHEGGGQPAVDGPDDDADSSVDGDDLGEVQVWSTQDADNSATVAALFDDAQDAAEDKT